MNIRTAILYSALLCALVPASPVEASTRFALGHRDSGFYLGQTLQLDSKEVAFAKEPDFQDHDVARSAIVTGTAAKDFIGFAWDRTAGTLHVDLNGDLDLTNDEGGTFTADSDGNYMQEFNNVRLLLDRGGVSVPYVVQVYFYTYSGSRNYGNLTILSGWQGEVTLHDKSWTLSVADNLDGVLDQRDQFKLVPLSEDSADAAVHGQTLPGATGLHLAGHAYDLDFIFEGDPAASVLAMEVADADVAMGTLNIEGESISRLTLFPEPGGYLVVADRPAAALTLPVGTYAGAQVYLNGGPNLVFESSPELTPTISETQPAHVKVGGPLNNSVLAEKRGSVIELAYELRGAGGEEYQGLNDDRRTPPRFVVHKGSLKLHSGKFEYG